MFENILTKLATAICTYGNWSAGLASFHGSYESEVPAILAENYSKN